MTKAEAKKQATLKKTLVRVYNEKFYPRHLGKRGTSPDSLFNNPELRGEFMGMLPSKYRERDVTEIQSVLQNARKASLLKARESKPSITWIKRHFSTEAQKVIEHALKLAGDGPINVIDLTVAMTSMDD